LGQISAVEHAEHIPAKRNWHYGNPLQISPVSKLEFALQKRSGTSAMITRVGGSGELIVMNHSENLFAGGVGQCAGQNESEQ
jgi:hypothetical protein